MRISGWWWIALSLGAECSITSCTSKQVEASGYTDFVEDGVATLRLPAQFAKIREQPSAPKPDLKPGWIGDWAGAVEDQNFFAVTHAFAFRESKAADGKVAIPALLVVSRVADRQSFSSAQLFFESGIRFSPDTRWTQPRRLLWKMKQISKSLSVYEATLEEGAQASAAFVMVDREALLQVLLLGERTALPAETAYRVLSDLSSGYRLTQPLEDYFHATGAALQQQAEKRRKNYLALLENLQKEELDYTPTPRVVVFNPNLAGQFWWPMFDRSGIPTHFAMAGRLGTLRSENAQAWKQLEAFFPGMRLVSAVREADSPTILPLVAGAPIGARIQSLLADTRWADNAEKQAFAAIEFSFTSGAPELSSWLNALEAASRQAEAQGLVQPLSPF